MATQKLSSHEARATSRLSPELFNKQQVAESEGTVTADLDSRQMGGYAQSGAQLIIDAAQAHWHLDLLGRDERDIHIRAIPHKGKAGGAINGNFAMDLERFQDLNNQGYGIYLQPNIGGTKAEEITLCTTQFFEHDDRPRSEQVGLCESLVGLEPTFQIDTQGQSIHQYLGLKSPIKPALWIQLMERLQLAAQGCDRACEGSNRMMRMAGSHYINRDGESQGQVQIINADGPRYSAEELDAVLPPLHFPKPQPAARKRSSSGRHKSLPLREIVNALEAIPQRVEGSGTYADYRDILWGLMSACRDIDVDEQVAIDLMEAHSSSHSFGWDVEQVARSGGEQIGAGTLFFHAKQHGWSRYAR